MQIRAERLGFTVILIFTSCSRQGAEVVKHLSRERSSWLVEELGTRAISFALSAVM